MNVRKWKYLSLTLLFLACGEEANRHQRVLHQNWKFRQERATKWKTATVPGVVHTDLLQHELIPHPWIGTNENEVQWIEGENWEYKTTFSLTTKELSRNRIDLVFEGLDTYAEVILNDSLILSADNMFRNWRVDVKDLLVKENELRVRFLSPIQLNKKKVESLGYVLPANETAPIKVSPFTRKAPYHFGWDWGPRLVTAGIWRPVYIESWDVARIENVQITQDELAEEYVDLTAIIELESQVSSSVQLSVFGQDVTVELQPGTNTIRLPFTIQEPERWWPNGWGEAKLYDIEVLLRKEEVVLDSEKVSIGLRTVELVQEKDSIGESFYFKINGEPFFARGANYIPQSHFLPSVKKEDYERLIEQVRSSGMNMIRVWGGGIYENDYFYELCDQNGIMVWQDFMFACSMYPGDEAFLESVEKEVEDNVKRLRNHPSIVHWNGNNEVDVAWKNWGWQKQYGYSVQDSIKIWEDYLELFHQRIPTLLDELDDRPYSTTSPLSNWGTPENFNYASMHYWGVWHGGDQFEDYRINVGRFMSEYGFQSFPLMETIAQFADSSEWNLDSETMKHHQKSYIGNGLVEQRATKYFGAPTGFEDFVEKSQQAQALAMQIAIDAHRLKKGHCWGTLFWQLNDCWPGPSWSAIDVFGREKRFYKELEALYAPITVIPQEIDGRLILTLVNDTLEDFEGTVLLKFKGEEGNEISKVELEVSCDANGLKQIYEDHLMDGVERVELRLKKEENLVQLRSVEMINTGTAL